MNYYMLKQQMLVLKRDYGVTPIIGAELEWTVLDRGEAASNMQRIAYLTALRTATASLPIHSMGIEQGRGQVEAALWHTSDIVGLITAMQALRECAEMVATSLALTACFNAKPFADDYGNGLHVHMHLADASGENLYWKREGELSPHLNHSIGGLLATMQEHLPIFAGSEAAYGRFVVGYNAPTATNWGMNNRTTALRIPDGLGMVTGMDAVLATPPSSFKRIEHRVSSAEAVFSEVLNAIMQGIEQGLSDGITAPAPVYGELHAMEWVSSAPT
jgi:glutamine synthetase